MAAAYSTNSATGPTDLLQKLVTFLTGQGWTSDSSVSYGAGWRAHLHKGSQYVNLRAFVNEASNIATGWNAGSGTAGYGIGIYLGTGYSGAAAWNAQAGGPLDSGGTVRVGAGMYLNSGSVPAYHFFDDGQDNITVVVDRGSGLISHMGWGPTLVKTGFSNDYWYFYGSSPYYQNVAEPGSGGPYRGMSVSAAAPMSHSFYNAGHYATAYVRVDAAVYAAQWVGISDSSGTTSQFGHTGRLGHSANDAIGNTNNASEHPRISMMSARGFQSAFTGAVLLPLHIFCQSAAARWIPIGYPRSVFFCAGVGNGLNSGQIYAVGGVNYLVFQNFAVLKAA